MWDWVSVASREAIYQEADCCHFISGSGLGIPPPPNNDIMSAEEVSAA